MYKIFCDGTPYAVKCFRYDNPEYERRYPAITSHLNSHRLSYFVGFRYMTRGIRVGPAWYPILKMKWTEGESLISYIQRNLTSPAVLHRLASSWSRLLVDLQKANIAHGDLQHGNVLVVGGDLKLVDYDGMYVPALDGSLGLEIGHRNYQHPERTELDFGSYLDNFSAWLIYVSIMALAVRPALWQVLGSGDECLLFRKQDLVDPEQSEAFRLLRAIPDEEVRDLIDQFENLLWLPPSKLPSIPERSISMAHPLTATTAVPEWLKDHVSGPKVQQPDSKSTELEEDFVGDPSWIIENTEAPPNVGAFQGQVRTDRLFAVCALLVAGGMTAWQAPASALGTLALFLLNMVLGIGATLMFWFLNYGREPALGAARLAHVNLRKATGEAESESAAYAQIRKERQICKETHLTEVQKTKERQTAVEVSHKRELAAIDDWLTSALRQIHDNRRSLAADEANQKRQLGVTLAKLSQMISALAGQQQQELNQLDAGPGQRIKNTEAQLQQVTSDMTWDLQRALKDYQDQIVLGHLHHYRIASASIGGIGAELKDRLAQAGFMSAADIVQRNVNVPGIGAKKLASLNLWVLGLDNMIRPKEAPQSLPTHKAADIERRYESSIRQLQQTLANERPQFSSATYHIKKKYSDQKQVLEAELATEDARVRQQVSRIERDFEARRNTLIKEEQLARQTATNRVEDCTRNVQTQLDKISAEEKRLRAEYAAELERLSTQLGEVSKRVREKRWRRDQAARKWDAYSHLSFRMYCGRVFGRS
ncbi:MAG: hypothetical protein ABL888_15155 [Pirellulaceae bacterium]